MKTDILHACATSHVDTHNHIKPKMQDTKDKRQGGTGANITSRKGQIENTQNRINTEIVREKRKSKEKKGEEL